MEENGVGSRYYVKGKRISLRRVKEDDWTDVCAAAHAMEVNPDEMWNKMFFSRYKNLYAVAELNDKTVVGFLEARNMRTPYPVVLCFIFEEFRRQGYGTESMQLFLEIIKKRKTKVEWFCTGCKDDNQAAQALIESLGGVLDMADTLGGPQALHRYAIEAGLEKEEDVRWFYSYSIPCK